MKKILFITYSFPPLLLPESIQTVRYIKFLLRHGWESHVLSVDENTALESVDNAMLKIIPADISIERTKSYEPINLMRIISKLFPFLLRIPDNKVGWYPTACKRAVSMSLKTKFDLIHSWACYHISNIVGLKVKKQTCLPWVVHFSDPWIDNPYQKYGRIDGYISRKMEKSVIENSDAVVFVSEETRQLVMKKYSSKMMDKSFVIPHCYDKDLFHHTKKVKNSKFTITYTGSFYGIRTPLSLFKAMSNIIQKQPDIQKSLNIQIIGKLNKDYKNMILKLGIDDVVSVIDMVPYLESLEYILNTDVLLLIDAPSEGPSVFLPLKLIEYIGSGNPILGVTPLEGASANLIKQVNGIVVDPNDVKGIEKAILTLYEKYQNGNLSEFSYSRLNTMIYDAENTVKRLSELFDMVIS